LLESVRLGQLLECPVDCGLSSWDAYTPCTRSCAGEQLEIATRRRVITHQPSHGGASCGPTEHSKECPLVQCSECS
jgi:hypothetical protein